MLALQYTFHLPEAYDLQCVRDRVAARGHLFDRLPGLAFKVFLISQKTGRATGNAYAPFYLWDSMRAATDFLMGEKFDVVTQAFGWPRLATWHPLAGRLKRQDARPLKARRIVTALPIYPDLGKIRNDMEGQAEAAEQDRAVDAYVMGYDPSRNETVQFALFSGASPLFADLEDALEYEVLHLARPGGEGDLSSSDA